MSDTPAPPEDTAGPARPDGRPIPAADQADPEDRTAELEGLRRALADLDNARKRCAAQITRVEAETRAAVAREWLPVIDNLDRALEHSSADPAAIIEGVRAVRDQALGVLAGSASPAGRTTRAPCSIRSGTTPWPRGTRPAPRTARSWKSSGRAMAREITSCGRRRWWWPGRADDLTRPRLLRHSGRVQGRQPGRHPAGLPQAGPYVSPGRQQGPRGRGPVQGHFRGLRRPLRSADPTPLRRVRARISARCPRTWMRRPGGGPAPERAGPAPGRGGPGAAPARAGRVRRRRLQYSTSAGDLDFEDLLGGFFGGRGGPAAPGVAGGRSRERIRRPSSS